eukprot:6203633-Pleurochrysis_carterae.AAC.3
MEAAFGAPVITEALPATARGLFLLAHPPRHRVRTQRGDTNASAPTNAEWKSYLSRDMAKRVWLCSALSAYAIWLFGLCFLLEAGNSLLADTSGNYISEQ